MSNVLDALIGRVNSYDPALANEISSEVKKLKNKREYGLVYEPHAPEGVRLWGKKVQTGDVVHILPPRGAMESKENYIEWKVASVKKGIAHVFRKRDDGGNIEQDVLVNDVVAYADFKQPIYPGLLEACRVERGSKDDPYHVVINGENFYALQALLWCYAGEVDCIYIDPPYNTGAKDWKYNNDYVDGTDQYKHSKWLSFMEQRLKLARKLLKKDSVMIVTIDEKEYLRLGMLLEQMFPEAKIQMVSLIIKSGGTNRRNEFSRTNEFIYIVMFGNILINSLETNLFDTNIEKISGDKELKWKMFRRRELKSTRIKSPNEFYPIFINKTTKCIESIGDALNTTDFVSSVKVPDNCFAVFPFQSNGTESIWGKIPSEARKLLKDGYIYANRVDVNKETATIMYLQSGTINEIKNGLIHIDGYGEFNQVVGYYINNKTWMPKTIWNMSSHDAQVFGSLLNRKLMPDRDFPYPKSLYAVEDCLRLFVGNEKYKDAVIVDFFSGSGTTCHATMLLNHLDGGHRQCISVTNNEIGFDNEKVFTKQCLRPTDKEWQEKGIAHYITWERIKAAITGINTKGEPIKGDYKFTEEFPMSDGFKENAVFFDLKYEDGKAIRLNMAFKEIAPLLWMRAGGKGRVITDISPRGYDIAEQYAVLFDYAASDQFIAEVRGKDIKVVFIVTDSESLYQQIYKQLPRGIEPVRLYENYLTSFAIYGAV